MNRETADKIIVKLNEQLHPDYIIPDDILVIEMSSFLNSLVSDWISVSDRLPENRQEIYFCVGGKVYEGQKNYSYWETRDGSYFTKGITHWMIDLLPPPPEA